MAFRKDVTTAAQTSANVAGEITSALIAAGAVKTATKAAEAAVEVYQALIAELRPVVEADNKVFEAAEAGESKSGGSKKSYSKSKKSDDDEDGTNADDPGDVRLKGGKFKGCTIREVYEMDADEAGDTYGHREGEAGSTYIDWLSTAQNPNKFTRDKSKAFLKAA